MERGMKLGLSLNLYPTYSGEKLPFQRIAMGFTRLCMSDDYRIFGQMIRALEHEAEENVRLEPKVIPEHVKLELTLPGSDLEEVREDAYGALLTYLPAGELKRLVLPADADIVNQATMAYINTLPDEWPVILYWH